MSKHVVSVGCGASPHCGFPHSVALCAALGLVAFLMASLSSAQVVMERAADGSVVITNQKRGASTYRSPRRGVTVAPGVQVAQPAAQTAVASARFALPATTPQIQQWVKTYADRSDLDEKLVLSLIAAESYFDTKALSNKGAIGLMQLMPGTARELGVADPWDPESNIRGGTTYLRQMLDRFDQDVELALAAYNAGPGAVERNGGIPPYRETQNYVRKVLSRFHGRPIDLSETRLVRSNYRPLKVSRDENGHLVILTRP